MSSTWETRRVKHVTSPTSKEALSVLKHLLRISKDEEFPPQFFQRLVILTSHVQHHRFGYDVRRHIRQFMVRLSVHQRKTVLEGLLVADKSLLALAYVVDCCVKCNLLTNTLGQYHEGEYKKEIVAKYLREVITAKEADSEWTLTQISEQALAHVVTPEEFRSLILPACQKAMLRSPETSIRRVAATLSGLQLDLSEFSLDLGKMLSTSFRSTDEASRDHALKASRILTKKVLQSSALKALVERYFSVVNGVDGKLTVAAQKICILKAIGEMSEYISVVVDVSDIAIMVFDSCIKALDVEVHEATLIEYLNVISLWCEALGDHPAPSLVQYVPKGLTNLKGPLRTTFCKCIATYFTPSRHKYTAPVIEPIQKAFEKMIPQLYQGSNLMECICLGLALMVSSTPPTESLVQQIIGLGHHIDRKLTDIDAGGYAGIVALYAQRIIDHHYEKSRPFAFGVLALGTTVKPYEARSKSKGLIQKVLKHNKSRGLVQDLIHAYERFVPDIEEKIRLEILRFLAHLFKEFLEGEELELAALDLLPLSVCSRPHYWLRIVQLMGLRPDKLVEKHWRRRLIQYVTDESKEVVRGPILQTLSLVHGEVVVEDLVKAFQSLIKGVAYKKVTRDEYFIYHTPEGQLHDQSVLETHEFDVMRNVKRESKAYSYKEQLEEINLRKELEQKRREAGKEPKLTQKQKDVMKAQLEKEDAIRKNIRTMDQRLQAGFLLLNSALKGSVGALGFCVKDFLADIIDLMDSSLSSPYAVKFYTDLGVALFHFDKNLGYVVSNVSLKVFNPKYDLIPEYESVSIETALPPLLTKLVETAEKFEEFNAANYAFMFPFFKQVIHSRPKLMAVFASTLDCTMATIKARVNGLDHSPEFIPRCDLTKLLYHLIRTTEHRLQQSAVNVLLELAKSCGEPLSPEPETAELCVHLLEFKSHLLVSRDAALRAVSVAYPELHRLSEEDQAKLICGIFQLCFDPVTEIADMAKKIWESRKFEKHYTMAKFLLEGVVEPCTEVRIAAAKALGDLMEENGNAENVTRELIDIYENHLRMTPPVFDDFGRVLQEGVDTWEGRHGVGLALNEIARSMHPATSRHAMRWLVKTPFLDRNTTVHTAVLDAALSIVQLHGNDCMESFTELIEKNLDQRRGDSAQLDTVRQSCVILMGCLARHIPSKDPRVKSIFKTLLDTLSTPSEKVQEAVANCLPALVPSVEGETVAIIEKLIKTVMVAEGYGERRGAAYGLAGMIKGLGVLSLKQHDIMNVLAEGMQDKKNFRRREGALMALELLCDFLGRLFEPYIVHVLPYLLQCLGDGNQYVREATENTARAVMSRLSGHGVKLVLPALLSALNEDSWRTKCGSVDLLGRMAYCAPKQLSGCLPMIVPHLIEVLGDSHVKVQESAAKALRVIGSVIRNPEIQTVVPVLLQALQDPAKKTTPCLINLLKTEFVHMVDSPSLALIMPVVERAFLDRSTENRRLACQIIGNMYSLTDHKDLAPYMNNVMPGIRGSLLDPVPEVRTVAAKALGSMTRGMGEKCYDDLLPWLMKTLVSESNSVDRSGAAQGLAEVIGALGVDKLKRFMPEIIRKADSDDIPPHVRDGYMMMFIYMPTVFENDFVPYIGQIINPILKALADENEFVRETALRAGQRIVTGFADTAILLLLPQLREGIFDDNWRIRYSSVQLLGDLLYKISGVSGKMSTESAGDDDNFGTESSQVLIIEKLGQERRNQLLAGLYMGRSDVALMVRQAALHVWKVIVANTPKTLREILPTLFSLILNFLASGSEDKRHVAARTLGDLVRKLGEKILPEIIPILENGLECPRPEERQGVCIGLSEIMAATSREMVLAFVENLVPTLRKALCDPIQGVRRAAAQTFGSLHTTVGTRALDEILPFLLRKLEDPEEGAFALDGLGQVLQAKSKAVMPYLIPQLISPPANMKALGILCSVAGEALSKQLPKIFPVLITTLKKAHGTSTFDEELVSCENVLLSADDELGVRLVIEELLDCCKQVKRGNRIPGVLLLASFLSKTKADIKPHVGTLLRALILLMIDPEPLIINATADAIQSVLKHVGREDQMDHVEDIRQAIRFARSDMKDMAELPGLGSVKAVKALLGVFREAILNGPPEMKEQGANGMSELVVLASAEALKPSVIHVTGPLIRILGDRYSPDVKVAVLDALAILLPKVGPNLRAFLPQLQITFQKAVNDENRNVRTKAEYATTQLVHVQGIQIQ